MYTDCNIPYWNDIHGSRRTSPVDLPEVWQDDNVFGLGAGLQRDQGKIMIINKALVHKGFTPLVPMFSDVSKITMFQSLNIFTGKSDDECFKICWKQWLTWEQNQIETEVSLSFPNRLSAKELVFALNPDAAPGSLLLRMNLSSVWKFTMPASCWVMSSLSVGCDATSQC